MRSPRRRPCRRPERGFLALLLVAPVPAPAGLAEDTAEVVHLLRTAPRAAERLWRRPAVLRALRLLAEQVRGIDYASLGLGWSHPQARTEYWNRTHPSFRDARSLRRSQASLVALRALMEQGRADEEAMVSSFVREIGLPPRISATANFESVALALERELLLPLRALSEGGDALRRTFYGQPLPADLVEGIVREITTQVLQGSFADWRYGNAVGRRQLEGLSAAQAAAWREPSRTDGPGGLVAHEDAPDELGFFWATKIGGPSHGFDIEGQCLLPLLANARHKVVLVSTPSWPGHPAGRAHFRLLWTHAIENTSTPVLWLETLNADFAAARAGAVDVATWQRLVLRHAVTKAVTMNMPLSLAPELADAVRDVAGLAGSVALAENAYILRPSHGVVEASDYLSDKHDWLQTEEEVTRPIQRCLFEPAVRGKASEL